MIATKKQIAISSKRIPHDSDARNTMVVSTLHSTPTQYLETKKMMARGEVPSSKRLYLQYFKKLLTATQKSSSRHYKSREIDYASVWSIRWTHNAKTIRNTTYIANPITVGKSVIIVENSAMTQLKYLDLFDEYVCACTCDNVNFE